MKTRIYLFIALFLLTCSFADSKEAENRNNPSVKGSINVFASPATYNLAIKWASEYCSLNPKLKINVINSTDKAIVSLLNKEEGIGFVTEESYAGLSNHSNWKIVVGRDVIVPVMNASNPLREEIYRKGISTESFARILESPDNQDWGKLLGSSPNSPIHILIANEASVKSGLSNFTKATQLKVGGITEVNGQEIISAIQKDPYALGFCRLTQIIDPTNQNIVANIKLVPIDRNGNGKIDYMENIYDNLQAFSRGVWIGKYPKALSGTIYSVSSVKPKNEAEVAFLKWVLADGQQYLSSNGYSDLVYNERLSQLEKIDEPVTYAAVPIHTVTSLLGIILFIIFIIVMAGVVFEIVLISIRNHKKSVINANSVLRAFDQDSVILPKGLYFDKTHTWAYMKKDGTVKIGIDDFLQHVTGTITRIEMKDIGDIIKKGELLITIIRKGKQLNIYSPVSGTVTAQNRNLISDSSLINSAPYSEGWVYAIEPSNWLREIQFLNMAEKYKTWLADEFIRLKDFFAAVVKANASEYALVAYQDGGALKDSVLADLGPEIWEDFQTKFMDKVR